ncbi:MAG TPA: FAD:protein FMN transferase [Schlesneria sp.]
MATQDPHRRRDFLTGQAARAELDRISQKLTERQAPQIPGRGPTLLLRTIAMACDFDIMLNPDSDGTPLEAASEALDLVHHLEQVMSVYRDDAKLSQLNRCAALNPVFVERDLYQLLRRAKQLSEQTAGGFDPTAGALLSLWRRARQADTIPSANEIAITLENVGSHHLLLDEAASTVAFDRPGVELNLGAIGKGYAVDRAGELLLERGVQNWLVHGGRSSIHAHGCHAGHDGWPVGLQNPLLPDKPFATLLLRDQALGTSGTAVQWFRHQGKRYGHILDPRTGWPVESMMSVSVIAPDAALADALSTAFFVLGVENALACCDNFPMVGAIFFPPPKRGRNLEPLFHNVSPERVFFHGN